MTPENRGNQPTSCQSKPEQGPLPAAIQGPVPTSQVKTSPASFGLSPAAYSSRQPQPAFQPELSPDAVAKKPGIPALVWGGLGFGLVALAIVAVLVIIPLFNRNTRTEADPFAVSNNFPPAVTAPVSGAVVTTTPSSAVSGPVNPLDEGEAPVILKGATGQVVGKGEFTKIDAIHYARGTATVGIGADGKKVLRFENFTSAQGPDLKVYLGARPDGSLLKEGGLNLGALPATDGSYNITLPDDLDLSKYKSVVIWCEAFSVTFSVASLAWN